MQLKIPQGECYFTFMQIQNTLPKNSYSTLCMQQTVSGHKKIFIGGSQLLPSQSFMSYWSISSNKKWHYSGKMLPSTSISSLNTLINWVEMVNFLVCSFNFHFKIPKRE